MSQHSRRSLVARPEILAVAILLSLLTWIGHAGDGGGAPVEDAAAPIPIDRLMRYGVSYAGIHCGTMTLQSFVDETNADDPIYHIVMTARTSRFFDSIYKVRTRIESFYSSRRMSSIRYHEHSEEKKKVKDKLYVVDFADSQVRRIEDGEEEIIPITSQHVYDPLSFLYRVRLLVREPGDHVTLDMMTTGGDIATVAEVTGLGKISTPFGKREAIEVVPRPAEEVIFSREGTMRVWLSHDDQRIPYRVDFELDFGRLVAKLKEIEGGDEDEK